tara:strand:- start:272 stop:604 length:333 start_codon:yes stop_codon:yes gene_type:complete
MKKLFSMILVLGLILVGNAYAEKLPKLICEVIEDGKPAGSVTHDFSDRSIYSVDLSSDYITYNYTGDQGTVYHEGEINRATGYFRSSVTFDNGQKFTFRGECKAFKANLF